jgi:hypothetical protein
VLSTIDDPDEHREENLQQPFAALKPLVVGLRDLFLADVVGLKRTRTSRSRH